MSKRIFDLFFSLAGLLVLSPFLLFIGLLIRVFEGAPVFFKQLRVGKNGKPFWIYKFRTMRTKSEGASLTVGNDPRITSIGSVLRRYKIDELPQLLNVVKGEMSLVGPRPEVPEYVELYSEEQRSVLNVSPGITDPASIKYSEESKILARSPNPKETYKNVILPDKLRINLEYQKHRSMKSDLKIIFATLFHTGMDKR